MAATLPVGDVHGIVRDAEPLDDPVPHRFRGSLRRRYDRILAPPAGFLHRKELLRCFNDTALPLEVRVAAALVRLYALPVTRIVELTDDHLRHDQRHTYLTVNHHPFVLPPKLARLIDDQLQHSPRHSNPAGCRYLLPGHSPGRPRNPLGLADTLRHHGLPARAARNTAMMEALVDLPPMVIADLLGIHPKTAERWATLAGGNWSDYLAARRAAPRG
ncbi:hypothetical protein AB0H86_26835 [Streptomyces sp. NPDC050997]|uniref:hypothetical protein n=1 Tax=Streptomyces sp. NPDC050997 TaxID=3155519 RepID=UPI003431F0A6